MNSYSFQVCVVLCVTSRSLYHEEFIDYLMRKDPDIKIGYLPFKGRNRVLYHTGRAAAAV